MSRLVIISNRVSLPRGRDDRAGGLEVAMRDALRAQGGIWFGWSGRVSETRQEAPSIASSRGVTYATVDLERSDHQRYYVKYANGTLWPLLHFRPGLLEYRAFDFEGYLGVNAYLARLLRPLLRPDDLVWINDYHLLTLGAELRQLGVGNRIGFFLHTPLPPPELLVSLPHHDIVFSALCACDLIGFQTGCEVDAFRRYVRQEAGGTAHDDGTIEAFGRRTRAATFPISIDPQEFAVTAERAAAAEETRQLVATLGGRALIIGVDRLDYSKGIPGRMEAIKSLLTRWPEDKRQFTYLQIAPISREDVRQYRALRREIDEQTGRINGSFSEPDWTPIRYFSKPVARRTLAGYLRAARIGFVTPFRDGMNLVAKEYVAAQDPADPGALVLSRFAGAAVELTAALQVNPYDIDAMAEALHGALSMSREERIARWTALRDALQRNTVHHWREAFLGALRATPAQGDTPQPACEAAT